MSRPRKLYWAGFTLLLVVCLAAAALFLLKHEPRFYRQSLAEVSTDSKDLSQQFVGQMTTLLACIIDGKGEWDFKFTQEQINSYFVEDFIGLGEAEALRKHGITEPRLVLENDKLRLAFRYGSGLFATVISYDLKVWLAPRDANVLAVEILGKRAGAIPMVSQALVEGIGDVVKAKGIEITWYRKDSNPVALVRFQADRPRPTAQLLRLAVRLGSLTIGGKSGTQDTHTQAWLEPGLGFVEVGSHASGE